MGNSEIRLRLSQVLLLGADATTVGREKRIPENTNRQIPHYGESERERENVCKDRTFKIQQAFPVMHTSIYLFVKLDILTFFFVVDDAVVKCIYAVILIPYVGYEIYLWKTS